jgi:hypothetical protein
MPDCMADDAVQCELLSQSEFPDRQGIYREISRIRALFLLHLDLKPPLPLVYFQKFPSERNREF